MQFPSAATRSYLINVAETIQHVLLPQLSGQAHARAVDCLHTVIRSAVHLDARDKPDDQGSMFESMDAEAMALIAQITSVAAPAGRSFDQARLETYLRAHALGGDALRIQSARLLAGGRSKQTLLATQTGSSQLPADLVVRQDWASSVVNSSVYSEFEVLKRLSTAGICVPQPLLLEPSPEALGAPFIVVTRLAGTVVGDLFTPPPGEQAVLDLADQMGRVHALPAQDFENLPGIAERNYTHEQLRVSLAGYRAIIDKLDQRPATLVTQALDWLEQTLERVHGPRSLVHGDVGFHNTLIDGTRLSAILDWELAHIGSPALDLGYLKSAVEQSMDWSRFMAQYRASGGPQIDAFVVDWYSLFTSVWFHHMVLQARAGLMSGALHDMEISFVCSHFGPMVLARISRKLAVVTGPKS